MASAASMRLLNLSPRKPPPSCPTMLNTVITATAPDAAVIERPTLSMMCGTRWRDTAPTVSSASECPRLSSQNAGVRIASPAVKPST